MLPRRAAKILQTKKYQFDENKIEGSGFSYAYGTAGEEIITLDGEFSLNELNAIVTYMRNPEKVVHAKSGE